MLSTEEITMHRLYPGIIVSCFFLAIVALWMTPLNSVLAKDNDNVLAMKDNDLRRKLEACPDNDNECEKVVEAQYNREKGSSTNTDKMTISSFQFAPAIGLEIFNEKYIEEAEVYGKCNTVRITDSYDNRASLWMMGQYVWQDIFSRDKKTGLTRLFGAGTTFAIGPFAAVRAVGSDAKVFDGAALGMSFVWYRNGLGASDADVKPPRSQDNWFQTFNVSVGGAWHRTKTLLEGIEEGQPLPGEYKQVEYEQGDEISWLLMFSGSL